MKRQQPVLYVETRGRRRAVDALKREGNRLSAWACGEDGKDFGLIGAVKEAWELNQQNP